VIRVGDAGTEAFSTPIVLGAPDATVAPFRTQASHFAAAIRGTAPALAPAADGVQLMQMVDALYASASERREVGLEKACEGGRWR
jgi:predicted dehydrogenase